MTPEQRRAKEFLDAMNENMKNIGSSKSSQSLFEREAARMAELNKEKDETPLKEKLIAVGLGIGVVGLLATFIFLPLTIYGIFATGFVGSKLWLWFLVPLGLPKITILNAAGIAMIARLFTYENPFGYSDGDKERTTPEKVGRFVGILILPWATLLIGYLIRINM